jgi:hypothetical protein
VPSRTRNGFAADQRMMRAIMAASLSLGRAG